MNSSSISIVFSFLKHKKIVMIFYHHFSSLFLSQYNWYLFLSFFKNLQSIYLALKINYISILGPFIKYKNLFPFWVSFFIFAISTHSHFHPSQLHVINSKSRYENQENWFCSSPLVTQLVQISKYLERERESYWGLRNYENSSHVLSHLFDEI